MLYKAEMNDIPTFNLLREYFIFPQKFMFLELDISPQLVQNIKQCEVATSLGTGYVRKPRMSHAGEERKRIQKIINESMDTRPDVSDYKELL